MCELRLSPRFMYTMVRPSANLSRHMLLSSYIFMTSQLNKCFYILLYFSPRCHISIVDSLCCFGMTRLSRLMTKPTKRLCAQRRLRSAQVPRLIWVFSGRTLILLVLSYLNIKHLALSHKPACHSLLHCYSNCLRWTHNQLCTFEYLSPNPSPKFPQDSSP